MKLLLALAGSGECLCDVGCDHALVGIAALMRGSYSRVIAMDINEGPLASARANRSEYGLDDVMELRLSDGLDALLPGEADTILISGMGGALIQDILTRGKEAAKKAEKLILSPQSEIGDFRRFLLREGYAIEDEAIVFDDGKYYFAMKAAYADTSDGADTSDTAGEKDGGKAAAFYPFGEAGLSFGGRLLEKKDPVLFDYLLRQRDKKEELLMRPGVAGSSAENVIKDALYLIEEAMSIYEG